MQQVSTAVPRRTPIRATRTQILVTLISLATAVTVWIGLYAGAQSLASTTIDHATLVPTEQPYYPGRPF